LIIVNLGVTRIIKARKKAVAQKHLFKEKSGTICNPLIILQTVDILMTAKHTTVIFTATL